MKLAFFSILLSTLSCVTPVQNTGSDEGTGTVPEKFTEMTAIKNDKCSFLLQDKSAQKYEVQAITSKIPNLSDGKKVWITFQPLRRMSVCGAQPIEITEVYK